MRQAYDTASETLDLCIEATACPDMKKARQRLIEIRTRYQLEREVYGPSETIARLNQKNGGAEARHHREKPQCPDLRHAVLSALFYAGLGIASAVAILHGIDRQAEINEARAVAEQEMIYTEDAHAPGF